MKKILIVLMAVLMVFACVSCNNGISEEECAKRVKEAEEKAEKQAAEDIETYKEFVRYKLALDDLIYDCLYNLDSSDVATASTKIGYTTAGGFYEIFYGGEEVVVEIDDFKDLNGHITQGTASGTKSDATFTGIRFEPQKYTIRNRKDNSVVKDVTSPETLTITDGYYKKTITGEEGNYAVEISMGITVNGEAYSIKYTYTRIMNETTYTSASVNGKTVTPELIITEDLLNDEEFYPYHDYS